MYKRKILIKILFTTISILFIISVKTLSYGETEDGSRTHDFSLTISPFHLILPVYEFTGEINLNQDFGLALIGGYGKVKVDKLDDSSNELNDDVITIYELGGQLNYYPVGSFDHGMQLGVEAQWLGLLGNHDNINYSADGLAVGPFIGYKVIFDFGLTFNVQLGYQKYFIKAEASDGSTSASDSDTDGGVLLNINAGWSF